jgi:pyruvate/2-oxoglutarate/acetoin dehydrogenase E1 component
VVEADFGSLKAAPKVLGALNTPMPYAASLEDACLPQVADIVATVRAMVASSPRE